MPPHPRPGPSRHERCGETNASPLPPPPPRRKMTRETGLFIRGNVFFSLFLFSIFQREMRAREGCAFIIFINIIVTPACGRSRTIGGSLGLRQRPFSRAANLERLDEQRSTGRNLFRFFWKADLRVFSIVTRTYIFR